MFFLNREILRYPISRKKTEKLEDGSRTNIPMISGHQRVTKSTKLQTYIPQRPRYHSSISQGHSRLLDAWWIRLEGANHMAQQPPPEPTFVAGCIGHRGVYVVRGLCQSWKLLVLLLGPLEVIPNDDSPAVC